MERVELPIPLVAHFLGLRLDDERCLFHIDKHVRAPTRMLGAGGPARCLKSILKLVNRAGRKGLPVVGAVLRSETRAQPRPEQAEEDVEIAWGGDVLLVIAGVREHRLVLPEIRIEPGVCGELALQARDHALSDLALASNIARAADKYL